MNQDGGGKFISTIQKYQEALACLEVAARCLRIDEQHRGYDVATASGYNSRYESSDEDAYYETKYSTVQQQLHKPYTCNRGYNINSTGNIEHYDQVYNSNFNRNTECHNKGYSHENAKFTESIRSYNNAEYDEDSCNNHIKYKDNNDSGNSEYDSISSNNIEYKNVGVISHLTNTVTPTATSSPVTPSIDIPSSSTRRFFNGSHKQQTNDTYYSNSVNSSPCNNINNNNNSIIVEDYSNIKSKGNNINDIVGCMSIESVSSQYANGSYQVAEAANVPLSDGINHCGDRKPLNNVDYAMIKGLVQRCTTAVAAIEDDINTDNNTVKNSLRSLIRSLLLSKLLLERLLNPTKSSERPQNQQQASGVATIPPAAPVVAPATAVATTSVVATLTTTAVDGGGHPTSFTAATAPDSDRSEDHVRNIAEQVSSMRSDGSDAAGDGGLAAVVGLEEVKQILHETFLWPTQFPHLFQEGGLVSWSRLLLYGPPGTGKTRLARALAADLRCPIYTITPSCVLSSWLGDTEKIIRELFRRVRSETGTVIVFLDEMDSLCRTRTSTEDDSSRRLKTELLIHLDSDFRSGSGGSCAMSSNLNNSDDCFDFNDDCMFDEEQGAPNLQCNTSDPYLIPTSSDNPSCSKFSLTRTSHSFRNNKSDSGSDYLTGKSFTDNEASSHSLKSGIQNSAANDSNKVFVIAATNCPWDIDSAFLRRFQKRCYVPLPQRNERRAILEQGLKGCKRTAIPEQRWSEVLDVTDGYSGADLNTLATCAAFRPLRELHTARFWSFTDDNMIMPCSSNTLGAMQYTLDKLPPNRVTVRPLVSTDLLEAQRCTPRSVPASLLRQYDTFHEA